jgi:hypothetical protein
MGGRKRPQQQGPTGKTDRDDRGGQRARTSLHGRGPGEEPQAWQAKQAAPLPPQPPPQPRSRVAPASVVTLSRALDMVGATPGAQVMAVRAVMGMEGDSLDLLQGGWLPCIEEKLQSAEAEQRAVGAGAQGALGGHAGWRHGCQRQRQRGRGGRAAGAGGPAGAALPGCTRGGAVCGAAAAGQL